MNSAPEYYEVVSSRKTERLFTGLAIFFAILCAGSTGVHLAAGWAIFFLCLSAFFVFYALNYRTLVIHMDASTLRLRFGIFQWTVPLSNIETCFPDPVSLQRIGGAGIHFTFIDGRYRAMFNFLEYPRVVLQLKKKKGPVRDIAFSTQHPDDIIRWIKNAASL